MGVHCPYMSSGGRPCSSFEEAVRDPAVWEAIGMWRLASRLSDRKAIWVSPDGLREVEDEEDELLPDQNVHLFRRGLTRQRDDFAQAAEELRREREVAPQLVATLLEMDAGLWRAWLLEHPEHRTATVVEALVTVVRETPHLPWSCFELTKLAIDVAEEPRPGQRGIFTAIARAQAWNEHALVLIDLGRYPDAIVATKQARLSIHDFGALALDAAVSDYVAATAYVRMGKLREAVRCLRRAAPIAEEYGDTKLYLKCRLLQAATLHESHRLPEAMKIWSELIIEARDRGDEELLGAVYNNAGLTLLNQGKLDQAKWHFAQAARIFTARGDRTVLARLDLNFARIAVQEGDHGRALTLFRKARAAFRDVDNSDGVASTDLETAELMLATGRHQEASSLCAALPQIFRELGMTTNALTAAAYLAECAAARRLDLPAVHHVKAYLADLPQNPERPFRRPGTVDA
jgi:tetratricopeptide (TPR) repeat protein